MANPNTDTLLTSINPGNSFKAIVLIDVPVGKQLDTVELHNPSSPQVPRSSSSKSRASQRAPALCSRVRGGRHTSGQTSPRTTWVTQPPFGAGVTDNDVLLGHRGHMDITHQSPAVVMASAAASSQEEELVLITSITRYTLMTTSHRSGWSSNGGV